MPKYHPQNEVVKRKYVQFLELAGGKQASTTDAALRAITLFEQSTGCRPFQKLHLEQIRKFRTQLVEITGRGGRHLSAATMTATLRRLYDFFIWLSREPGFRSKINPNVARYFLPTDQDVRIARARREKLVATIDDVLRVLSLMPAETDIQKRDRAVVAFILLTGARDGAVASLRLKHLDLSKQTLFQDGREVATKGRKTITSYFFPVGDEPLEIVTTYVARLRELGFGPDDPIFPATELGKGPRRGFAATGLSRKPWKTAASIRGIFKNAFALVGLPSYNPHSIRNTLVQLGERICSTPEAWKCWSQNLGHEHEMTTFVGYGVVSSKRQAEIFKAFRNIKDGMQYRPEDIGQLQSLLSRMQRVW